MTLALRLLRGYVGSDQSAVTVLTTASQGGAVVVNQPWAQYRNGRTFIVYVRGDNGNIEIVTYTHATGITSSPFVLHAALQIDVHAAPSLCVLASGHIVVAYSVHSTAPIYVRVSTNVEDISAWNTEQTLHHGASTYCNLFELTIEAKLYLFFRYQPGTGANQLYYITSADGGASWSADAQVYANGTNGVYWHVMGNGVDRIDFAVTDLVPSIIGGGYEASLGHFYYKGGAYYKSDGTLLGSPPFAYSDTTPVISGPAVGGGCFPFGFAPAGPTLAVNVYLTGGVDNAYYDCRWTGTAWQVTLITNAGGVFYSGQACGLIVDNANPDAYICVLLDAGSWQAFSYVSSDNGVTWQQREQLTSTLAPVVHAWPSSIWQHAPDLRTIWLEGTYTSDTVWATGISGVNR